MKIPKLKYFYYAMTSDAYIDFAVRREIDVDPAVSIDLLTGAVTGRTHLHLCSGVDLADSHFRLQHNNYKQPVYVLRIPGNLVDRKYMEPVADGIWTYKHSMRIEHCGVERVELDLSQPVHVPETVDNQITITI